MLSSLSKKKSSLIDLSFELSNLLAAEFPGEDFHEDYKKDRDNFRNLVSIQNKLERDLKKYFKELAGRLVKNINWGEYLQQVVKGASIEPDKKFWDTEKLIYAGILGVALGVLYDIGAESGAADLGVAPVITSRTPEIQKKLREYNLSLSGDLADTSLDTIKETLKTGVAEGLSMDQMTNRVYEQISDPYRAQMIAHTESIRLNQMGKLDLAQELGIKYKRWSAVQTDPGEVCALMDNEVVEINDEFSEGYDAPPAHPWCRCVVRLENNPGESINPNNPSPSISEIVRRYQPGPDTVEYEELSAQQAADLGWFAQQIGIPYGQGEEYLQKYGSFKITRKQIKNLHFPQIDNYVESLIKHGNTNKPDFLVGEYVKLLESTEAPAIITDGNNILDGLHRLEAYIRSGRKTINAIDIRQILPAYLRK